MCPPLLYINNIISVGNEYKYINEIVYFPFFFLHFQIRMCNTSHAGAMFSLEISDLYLDFIKFTVEKVSQTHSFQTHLQAFQ